jgi:hypothetical protein
MMNRFLDLEADAIIQLIQTTEQSLAALVEQFCLLDDRSGRWNGPLKVLAAIEADLGLLSKPAPLLCQLLFRGIRPRHWQQLSEIVGFEFNTDSAVSLETVLSLNLGELCEPISAVCENAVHEYGSPRAPCVRACACARAGSRSCKSHGSPPSRQHSIQV